MTTIDELNKRFLRHDALSMKEINTLLAVHSTALTSLNALQSNPNVFDTTIMAIQNSIRMLEAYKKGLQV